MALCAFAVAYGGCATRVTAVATIETAPVAHVAGDPKLAEAIHAFENTALLTGRPGPLYNLALAYEVAGRFDDARRIVGRLGQVEALPISAKTRIEALRGRLAARAQGAKVQTPIGREAIIEGARREAERQRCGGDHFHP